jgi:hypothetical protein
LCVSRAKKIFLLYLPCEALMFMKSLNRTVTCSRMTVFDIQGRFVEFSAIPSLNRFAATAQKPVTGLFENGYSSNQQLHDSVFIPGSEEIIPEANLLPASAFNRSRRRRTCISVSQNKQATALSTCAEYYPRQLPFWGAYKTT